MRPASARRSRERTAPRGKALGGAAGAAFLAFLTLILSFFFALPGAPDGAVFADAPGGAGGGPFLRVGLHYGSGARSSVTLRSDSGFIVGAMGASGVTEGLPLPGYRLLTVSADGRYAAVSADGVTVSSDIGSGNCLLAYDYASGGLVSCDGSLYRGGIAFVVNRNNTLTVVNYLSEEAYIYGVLHAEMGRQNPAEALKAQAVAARSYASARGSAHLSDGFNLCATTHCQVYKGYANEYPETCRATDETAGLRLYYEGKIAAGYFYKNSGGHTQSSEDVWGNAEGYLRGVADAYSPDYKWVWATSFSEIGAILAAGGRDVGEPRSVSITRRSDSGSVTELTVTGTTGTVKLEREGIRTGFGGGNVKSLLFSFGGYAPAGASAAPFYGTGGKLPDSVSVLSADGLSRAVSRSALSVLGAQGASGGAAGADTRTETVTRADSEIVAFSGAGYGHGVGMPQDSAIEMAKAGFGFRDILMKFYTGVEIR